MKTNNILPTVIRRDLFGTVCLICGYGVYALHFEQHPDGVFTNEDYVVCWNCNDVVERWRTKREMMQHQSQGRGE